MAPLKILAFTIYIICIQTDIQLLLFTEVFFFFFLQKGELIKIIKKHEDGSWFGEVKNKTGKFPFNYVQIVDNDKNGV